MGKGKRKRIYEKISGNTNNYSCEKASILHRDTWRTKLGGLPQVKLFQSYSYYLLKYNLAPKYIKLALIQSFYIVDAPLITMFLENGTIKQPNKTLTITAKISL